MKVLKIAALFLFCLLACRVSAQQKTPQKTQDPSFKLFFEKAYLHIDRTYYSSGEDIWFAAYLVNGKSTSLTGTSGNLYVELINPNSNVIDRKMIRIDQGLGKGDFNLKDTLASGWYHIRAYTNWMRNFGNDFVFQQKIFIKNTPTNENNAATKAEVPTAFNAKKTIAFFPEGGSLIDGINAIVAFKATDEFGNGIKTRGSIISSKGDTVTTFQSPEAGMGIFAFMPSANEKYKVEGFFNNEKFTSVLPVALKSGFSMHAVTDSAHIKITISTNEASFNELQGKPVAIVIKRAGDNVYTGTITLSKQTAAVTIPTKDLPSGIAVLTILDHLGRPHCERLVYIQSANKVTLSVIPTKTIYGTREKVTLNVGAKDALGQPAKTSLSIAVVDGLVPSDANHMVSYLTLQSEIKGEIKNADQYFDVSNVGRLKQLDLLLLTQGWRDYLWRKLSDSGLTVSYMPEPGITIRGQVREKVANKPIADMNITLFGSTFEGNKIYTTKTDANGNYFLDGLKWSGNQAIKLSSQDSKGKKGGWLQIDTTFKPLPVNIRNYNLPIIPAHLDEEITKRVTYNRAYKTGDPILLKEVSIVTAKDGKVAVFDQNLTTFGYKDQEFNITAADYSYKGLEHYLLTNVKGAYAADDVDSNANEGITFLANGKRIRPRILINNKEDIQGRLDYYSLTMDQINRIVVKHLIGNTGEGSEDVYTINLDLKESALMGPNLNLLNVNLNGYYTARTFYAPDYAANPSSNKDLRTTIFWAPYLKTNDKGEVSVSFFNTDNNGEVVIKANGVTDHGVAVTAKTTYQVK